MKPNLELPECLKSEVVCSEFGVLSKDTLKLPHTPPYQYFKHTSTPFACMALPFTEEGKLVLNFEYRHPVGEILLSCPGGLVEDQEDPAAAALREFREETGFISESATFIGASYPFPGLSTQKILFYKLSSAKDTGSHQREKSELIETIVCSLEEVETYIADGKPTDGMLVQALYFWKASKMI